MSVLVRQDVTYVVKDELTLGYFFDEHPEYMGVLSSKKGGHNPVNGPVTLAFSSSRPATEQDFHDFRVKIPPDFKSC